MQREEGGGIEESQNPTKFYHGKCNNNTIHHSMITISVGERDVHYVTQKCIRDLWTKGKNGEAEPAADFFLICRVGAAGCWFLQRQLCSCRELWGLGTCAGAVGADLGSCIFPILFLLCKHNERCIGWKITNDKLFLKKIMCYYLLYGTQNIHVLCYAGIQWML